MLNHDVPDRGVILQTVRRHILAVARKLLPAVRHFAHQHEMGVNPGAAILQTRAQAMRPADVPGPDRRSQTILRIVGPAQRLLFVMK